MNLNYSNHKHIIPAYKDPGPGGFWKFFHYSEPHAFLAVSPTPNNADLWHLRFGHLNNRSNLNIMENVLQLNPTSLSTCKACTLGKHVRSSHSGSLPRSEIPAYFIHCNLAGPFPVPSTGGFHYSMVLIDDATRRNWIILLKFKSQAFDAFKQFHSMICNQTSFKIAIFKTDCGGEFTSNTFTTYLNEHGIVHEMGPPESPEQNSVAESFMRTSASRI